jgi:hypothetical protein
VLQSAAGAPGTLLVWPRRVSVFKPLDLHRRYPQQGRRLGSPCSGARRYARGHKTQDLYKFE